MSIFPCRRRKAADERSAAARAAAAEVRAREVAVRADRVAGSLTRRLRENHFAEGLSAAWGAGRHRA